MDGNVRLMQGNEACIEGALLAGCRFFAGYPITPASELAEVSALRMPQVGGIYIQMEDELASVNALIGASWGGLKVMTGTSGPGFTLMQEGIGYMALTQTPGVIVDVMRGGPSTGQPTLSSQQDVYQARYGSHGDYEIIVLAPSSAQEALDLTIRAFVLAERYATPVIVLSDEIVGHTRERVVLPETLETISRRKPPEGWDYKPYEPIAAEGGVPYRACFGEGHNILVDGQLHDYMGTRKGHDPVASARCVENICVKIRNNIDKIADYELYDTEDADKILVAYGSVARTALRAQRDARATGMKVGMVRLRTLFPFPDGLFAGLARAARTFFVPEMSLGRMWRDVKLASGRPVVSLPKIGGEMHTPGEIFHALEEN
ncbi:MAG: 2-oxoacid:acceptor oxidoreductase subunit alpha [Desulfovibrio sp.]|jgi:2-oxoglutarate ferredoxin oxidoreductase subunit alpha|nr:2-oxoacid:acceptor oxidoreductase subunit alpha [Desulfovibrio sp.]